MSLIRLTKAGWNPAASVTVGYVHLNPDQIESIQQHGDRLDDGTKTAVHLNDGTAVMVKESASEIAEQIQISRGER